MKRIPIYIFFECFLLLFGIPSLRADCGTSSCGEVKMTNLEGHFGSKINGITILDNPYLDIDGYRIDSSNHINLRKPPLTLTKNVPFTISYTPAVAEYNPYWEWGFEEDPGPFEYNWGETTFSFELGCGTKEIDVNGHVLKIRDSGNENNQYYYGDDGLRVFFYLKGCKAVVWIWMSSASESLTFKVIDPDAGKGCPGPNSANISEQGGFEGSGNSGASPTGSAAPIWSSSTPEGVLNMNNWTYRGGEWLNKTASHSQVRTSDRLYDIFKGSDLAISSYDLDDLGPVVSGLYNQAGKTPDEVITYSSAAAGSVLTTVERNGEVVDIYDLKRSVISGVEVREFSDRRAGERRIVKTTTPVGSPNHETKVTTEEKWWASAWNSDFSLVSKINTTYQNSDDYGYRPILEVVDPNGAALATSSVYAESEVGMRINPDGSWFVVSEYGASGTLLLPNGSLDPNFPGSTVIENLADVSDISYFRATYKPWLDTPAPGLASLVTDLGSLANYQVDLEFSYNDLSLGEWVDSKVTLTGNLVTSRVDTYQTESGVYTIKNVRTWSSETDYTVNSTWYGETSPGIYGTYKIVDGNGGVRRFSSAKGAYTPGADVSGTGEYSQTKEWDAEGSLVANLSTRTVTINDPRDRLVENRLEVFTGGSSYEIMSTETWVYDDDLTGRNVGREHFKNGILVDRETRTGTVSTSQSIGGPLVTTVSDNHDRTISVIESTPGRADIVTSHFYQGLSEAVTTTSGSLIRSRLTSRDLAGRSVSETDEQGITLGYAYTNSGLTITTTSPGGATEISTTYLDGRQKSRTGSGVIPVYWNYSVGSGNGFISTTECRGGISSLRYVKTTCDWNGNIRTTERPSPAGSGAVTETRFYNSGERLVKVTSGTSLADQCYTYDPLGNVLLSGLDMDGDGSLTRAGTDRITESTKIYEKIEGRWWQVSTARQYHTIGSAVDVYTSIQRTVMAPFLNDGAACWISVTIQPGGLTLTSLSKEFFGTATEAGKIIETFDSSATTASPDRSCVVETGRLISSSQYGSSLATTYEYDAFNRVIKVTDPRGGVGRTAYDALDRVSQTSDHFGNTTVYGYYPSNVIGAGQLKSVTQPDGVSAFRTYNLLGQCIEISGSGTHSIKYTYNGYGDLATYQTTRNGSAWDTTTMTPQEGTGLLKEKIYPGGNKTTYTYYDHGGVHVRTWQRGVTTTYSYDGALDLTGINYSDSTPDVSFTPDRLGRPRIITDGGGTLTRAYHSSLPVAKSDTYDSSHAWLRDVVLTHTWDADDARRTAIGVSWGSASYSTTAAYDAVTGRVASYTGSNTFRHEYAYAPGTSLITGINHFNGTTPRGNETRQIDLRGRLYGIYTKDATGTTITRHGYTMDGDGRRTKEIRENAEYWEYAYNDRSELIAGKKHMANGNFLAGQQFEYAYDAIGNRSLSKSGGDSAGANLRTFGYTPDARNQYHTLTYPATFDVIGRSPVASGDSITSTLGAVIRQGEHYRVQGTASNTIDADWKAVDLTYTVPIGAATVQNGHLFVPKHEVTPEYDADGNLKRDGRWSYVWDAENRLVSMTSIHDNKPSTRIIEFAYDWMGRRIEKKVSERISSIMTVTDRKRFTYDGWNIIAEFSIDGSDSLIPARQYTWGTDLSGSGQGAGGVGGLLSISNSGTPLIGCYDGNGSVVAWMNDDGATVAKQEYDPFGNRLIQEGLKIPIRFSTKYEDVETGLIYYGYRYYDSAIGRWASRDPIEEIGGLNLYSFVNNEAVNTFDVLGKISGLDIYNTISGVKSSFSGKTVVGATGYRDGLQELMNIAPGITVKPLSPTSANAGEWHSDEDVMYLYDLNPVTVIHEMVHAYNDLKITGISLAGPDDEGMAHLMANFGLPRMDMLSMAETLIRGQSDQEELRSTVNNSWKAYWANRADYGDWGSKQWMWFGRFGHRSAKFTKEDFVNLKKHLGVNFTCEKTANAINDILSAKKSCLRVYCGKDDFVSEIGGVEYDFIGAGENVKIDY